MKTLRESILDLITDKVSTLLMGDKDEVATDVWCDGPEDLEWSGALVITECERIWKSFERWLEEEDRHEDAE